ncbi:MAG: hypothetical protein ACYC9O_03040 [Candidatus Latescibacterota bacterium]
MSGKRQIPILLLMLVTALPFIVTARKVFSAEQTFVIPEPGQTQIITTEDGSTLVGRITRIGETDIEFQTEVGAITIPRSKIRSIRTVSSTTVRKGRYWFPDPNRTRLLFAPTGRMLEKGEGYFADYYVFFPTVNYGITDRVSLGGGMSLFPTGNLADQIYFFTPKFGIKQSGRVNFAAGALVIGIPGIDDDDVDSPVVSLLYGVGTWGGTDRHLTLGLGYGMADAELADRPLIMLGGVSRLSRRTALISENWMMPGVDNVLISYGIRLFTENLSVDLALLNTIGEESLFPGVPYVDFVWNF